MIVVRCRAPLDLLRFALVVDGRGRHRRPSVHSKALRADREGTTCTPPLCIRPSVRVGAEEALTCCCP